MFAIAGCGSGESNALHISGTVEYEKKPLKYGTILFEPDTSKGGRGAPGTAVIKDGKFDTKTDGSPTTGGPQIVTVQGFTGEDLTEYAPHGTMIANGKPFIKSYELPASGTTELNLDLDEVLKSRK